MTCRQKYIFIVPTNKELVPLFYSCYLILVSCGHNLLFVPSFLLKGSYYALLQSLDFVLGVY